MVFSEVLVHPSPLPLTSTTASRTQGPCIITGDVYSWQPYLEFGIQLNHIKYLIGLKALINTIFYIFEGLNWASVAYLQFINHHYIFWGMDSDFQRSIHKWIFGRKTICPLSYIHSFLKYIFSYFAYGSLVKSNIPLLLQRRLSVVLARLWLCTILSLACKTSNKPAYLCLGSLNLDPLNLFRPSPVLCQSPFSKNEVSGQLSKTRLAGLSLVAMSISWGHPGALMAA